MGLFYYYTIIFEYRFLNIVVYCIIKYHSRREFQSSSVIVITLSQRTKLEIRIKYDYIFMKFYLLSLLIQLTFLVRV